MERIHRVFSLVPKAGADTRRRFKSLLRAVLVKSEAERDVLERVCDAWLERIEVEDVPAPLRRTAQASFTARREDRAGRRTFLAFVTGAPRRRWLVALALTVAVMVAVRLAPWERLFPETTAPPPPPPSQETRTPDQEPVELRRQRFDDWTELTVKPPDPVWTGWPPFGLGVGALLAAGGLWLSLYRRRYLPAPAPIPEHRGPPRILLPPSAPRTELVDAGQQEALVWGIGQFLSEEPTRRVDLGATVRETARDAGLLHLVFERARYQREVWLWVDEAAEDPTIRVLADEVAATLTAHGLPVERASFRGVPERLVTEDEEVFAPREVDERRDGAIVAVLTDGRVLSRLHAADDRAVKIDALLRLLSRWPRIAFVDFSGGTNDLRRRLSVHGIEAVAPEELPAFLGALKTAGKTFSESDPLWAGACALSPAPVAERTAFELRRRLGLGSSPWAFRSLRAEAGGLPERLSWSGAQRARAVNWLVESEAAFTEDGVNPASLLGQALDFWEERFDEEIDRQRREAEEDVPWDETPGGQHLLMERELLRLWRRPDEAVRELYRFHGGGLRDMVRNHLAGFAPRRRGGEEHVRLPWRWEELTADVRVMLLEMGLGGTLPEETLRRPGRVWLGIGAAMGLAAGAFAVAATKPTVVPEGGAAAECRPLEGVDENGMEFVRICAGAFLMGSEDYPDESPVHQVTLGEFWMGKYEVTNEEYRLLHRDWRNPDSPDHPAEPRLPVTNVDWNDARTFCESFGYQLPTEAEWEYAARAGTTTLWSHGDDEGELGRYAWFGEDPRRSRAHPVGEKEPNPWGLYDMHGNVWELVEDWYGPYSSEPLTNPGGPPNGSDCVLRGGSFFFASRDLRSAERYWVRPEDRLRFVGFRCVRGRLRQP